MGHDPTLLKFLMNPLKSILVFHHSHVYRRMEDDGTNSAGCDTPRPAVELHHVYKSYGHRRNKLHVLQDLNMSVQTGIM